MQGNANVSRSQGLRAKGPPTIPITDMLEIIKFISRVEPIDVLLDKVGDTIAKSFGVSAMVICTMDEQSGMFVPRCVKGFPEDNASRIRKHSYSPQRVRKEMTDEHRVDQRTYFVRAESVNNLTNDDIDYILDTGEAASEAGPPDRWHPLDCMCFMMVDRLGNWIGWIEIDHMNDGKVPGREAISRIQLLADLTGIAIENSKTYEDAISAMSESQGYLDLIVHDIGNIINPLIYYLEKAAKSGLADPDTRESVEKALEVSEAARGLVNNVRKLSEARASQCSERERYDLRDVLVRCMSTLKRDFPSRDIVVSFDCPEEECTVLADDLVTDLFMNLLNNAVKHNPRPLAELEVAIENGPGVWTVYVEDHGTGIPDDRKDLVFSRFVRRAEGVTGSGMGLSIVDHLVARYNGMVTVSDRVAGDPSEGACFEVALPKAPENENGRPANGASAYTLME